MGERESEEREYEVMEQWRGEPFGLITEQKARKKIAECFPNTATLYAVLIMPCALALIIKAAFPWA